VGSGLDEINRGRGGEVGDIETGVDRQQVKAIGGGKTRVSDGN
jgi:hypothetical protein